MGEGSDLAVCAMAVVRREIDFDRSSKLDTAGPNSPHHQWGSYSMGCMDAQIDKYVK